jgi:hypothetical protein
MDLARKGAKARISELEAEIAELRKLFGRLPYGSAVSPAIPARDSEAIPPKRRKRRMSADQRKAVSLRMKKYWASRRAGKKGKKR